MFVSRKRTRNSFPSSVMRTGLRALIVIAILAAISMIPQNTTSANTSAPTVTAATSVPTTLQLSVPSLCSDDSAMSQNGDIVAVGCNDGLYVLNTITNKSHLFSVGAFNVSISPNGRFIAFGSSDTRILQKEEIGRQGLFVFDQQVNDSILQSTRISESYGLYPHNISITDDGQMVLFARSDDPGCILNGVKGDVLALFSSSTGQQANISCEHYGTDMAMSSDGSLVVYRSGVIPIIHTYHSETGQKQELFTGVSPDGTPIPASE